MPKVDRVDALLNEAFTHPTSGWDFGWLGDRIRSPLYSWHFEELFEGFARTSTNVLDLGTGGGEWLGAQQYRPAHTVATESWTPNVALAAASLGPRGVAVVHVVGAPDNVEQRAGDDTTTLPFVDGSFDLVVARHESFEASDVRRVLRRGGHFMTEQVGDGCYNEFRLLLAEEPVERVALSLDVIVEQLERAGLRVIDAGAESRRTYFADVGALVWYLRMVPWIVPEFSLRRHRDVLYGVQATIERDGPLGVALTGLCVTAVKPSDS